MPIALLLLQAVTAAAPTVTLAEAKSLSPTALADRLLPAEPHGPIDDAIVNGRGVLPPSASVTRVWLFEQMVPFSSTLCRSHVRKIEMGSGDPAVNPWGEAVPTHPVRTEQFDRLWVPPAGRATPATCAAAPKHALGASVGTLDLEAAAELIDEGRRSFAARNRRVAVTCGGLQGRCANSRRTLAQLDWRGLGAVEQVRAGHEDTVGGSAKTPRRCGSRFHSPRKVRPG